LEEKLVSLPQSDTELPERDPGDMIREILELARGINQRISSVPLPQLSPGFDKLQLDAIGSLLGHISEREARERERRIMATIGEALGAMVASCAECGKLIRGQEGKDWIKRPEDGAQVHVRCVHKPTSES
jgi:hypothetical protein